MPFSLLLFPSFFLVGTREVFDAFMADEFKRDVDAEDFNVLESIDDSFRLLSSSDDESRSTCRGRPSCHRVIDQTPAPYILTASLVSMFRALPVFMLRAHAPRD